MGSLFLLAVISGVAACYGLPAAATRSMQDIPQQEPEATVLLETGRQEEKEQEQQTSFTPLEVEVKEVPEEADASLELLAPGVHSEGFTTVPVGREDVISSAMFTVEQINTMRSSDCNPVSRSPLPPVSTSFQVKEAAVMVVSGSLMAMTIQTDLGRLHAEVSLALDGTRRLQKVHPKSRFLPGCVIQQLYKQADSFNADSQPVMSVAEVMEAEKMHGIHLGSTAPLRSLQLWTNSRPHTHKQLHGLPALHLSAGASGSSLGDDGYPIGNLVQGHNSLPTAHNVYDAYPHCKLDGHIAVRDQGSCGSSYAFAATSMLNARYCVAQECSVGNQQGCKPWPSLSAQALVSCGQAMESDMCHNNKMENMYTNGCRGAAPELVFDYLATHGVPSTQCYPYVQGNAQPEASVGGTQEAVASCKTACAHENLKAANPLRISGEEDMQLAIMNGGPIFATMNARDDLLRHTDGVYNSTQEAHPMGTHSVMIYGWGEESGIKYWHALNSWGTGWGERGTFKLVRGQDESGVESLAVFMATPAGTIKGNWETSDLAQVFNQNPCVRVRSHANKCTLTNTCAGETRQVGLQFSKLTGESCGPFKSSHTLQPAETLELVGHTGCLVQSDALQSSTSDEDNACQPSCLEVHHNPMKGVVNGKNNENACIFYKTCNEARKVRCASQPQDSFTTILEKQGALVTLQGCQQSYKGEEVCKLAEDSCIN